MVEWCYLKTKNLLHIKCLVFKAAFSNLQLHLVARIMYSFFSRYFLVVSQFTMRGWLGCVGRDGEGIEITPLSRYNT